MWIARSPGVVGAPDVVEEPVAHVDARAGSSRRPPPSRRERLRRGLGPRDLTRVDVPVDQVEHAVPLEDPLVEARGQIVLERTPTLMPVRAQRLPERPDLGIGRGVRLPELAVGREQVRVVVEACLGEQVGDGGALLVVAASGPRSCRRPRAARCGDTSTSWSAFTTACASASDSAWKSMSCQRVSVPPQSKMTASIRHGPDPSRHSPARDFLREPLGLVERDERACVREPHQAGVGEGRGQPLDRAGS